MRVLALFAVGLFATELSAAPVPKDDKKVKDEEAIVGTWEVESFDAGGEKLPDTDVRLRFGEKGKFDMLGEYPNRREGTFKLDPTAKLKTIDIKAGEAKILGLYELDGDTLKWCYAWQEGVARPEEMKANGKAGIVLVTLKRVKDEKKEDKKDK